MTQAIQETLCRRCEEPTDEPIAEVRRGDMACGPCRAELTGTIYLVAPNQALPSLLTAGLWREDQVPTAGQVGPTGGEAIHGLLEMWCNTLVALAGAVQLFDRHLMETTSEQEVADAVMGEEPLAGAQMYAHSSDSRALVLEGLPGDLARRLVQSTFAKPPSQERVRALTKGKA